MTDAQTYRPDPLRVWQHDGGLGVERLVSSPVRSILVAAAVVGMSMPIAAQLFNMASITIAGGRDKGSHVVQVSPKSLVGPTCVMRPRLDGPGSRFSGSFHPDADGVTRGPKTTAGGPMETSVAFYVNPDGRGTEVDLAIAFVGADFDMRAYEVNTMREVSAARRKGGPASVTFARSGTKATATITARTAEGVDITLSLDCQSVADGR